MKATMLTTGSYSEPSPVTVLTGNYFPLAESFYRSLRARNSSPRTLDAYSQAVQSFGEWLATSGRPLDVEQVTANEIRAWEQSLQDRGNKPSTVNNRHRGLQAFFKWLVIEEEVKDNPMIKVATPQIKEVRPLVVVTDEQFARLLKGCEGKGFEQHRDMAIIRLFLATPLRLSEIANIQVDDIDLDRGKVRVLAKGGRYRDVDFGARAAAALDRYKRRERAEHRASAMPWFWLGKAGRFTSWGVAQMVKDRARAAGFPKSAPARIPGGWMLGNPPARAPGPSPSARLPGLKPPSFPQPEPHMADAPMLGAFSSLVAVQGGSTRPQSRRRDSGRPSPRLEPSRQYARSMSST